MKKDVQCRKIQSPHWAEKYFFSNIASEHASSCLRVPKNVKRGLSDFFNKSRKSTKLKDGTFGDIENFRKKISVPKIKSKGGKSVIFALFPY